MNSHLSNEALHNVALGFIPKLGPTIFKTIVSYCGSAEGFFTLPQGKLAKIPGIGPKLLAHRKSKETYLKEAESLLEAAYKNNIQVHCYPDASFPSRLKALPDAPPILFSKGKINLNPKRSVGIVGTRNASNYGRTITQKITEELARFQPTIVSGLAYGIDVEAHRAALSLRMPTIGVMGSDLATIYPAAHKHTAEQMMENGGLLSEFKLGTPMNPTNFPQRNRIIAGLSDALIVVEAAKKGGALITAEIAYSYNREVFAVPGNLQSKYSEGCNNLIRSLKAGIYLGVRELEESLSWDRESDVRAHAQLPDTSELDATEVKILERLLEKQEAGIDWLSRDLGIPISELAIKLLNLEFLGFVKAIPGKKYQWMNKK
ncbi:DNA processing protein [Cyclobacterium xiamenense]|uniref:DNA processing protein n=1 Tax=Cyclobacterium xiamenense TaxID=1297121 RepID=A0A1H6Z821_9BACT|nr:DNA-processing protein DprA [Cyclobacterium xiamenense]SEJ45085.1 DNA processing protein [Cyclobacterium xiamenense]